VSWAWLFSGVTLGLAGTSAIFWSMWLYSYYRKLEFVKVDCQLCSDYV
jgi:hypothetical protein